MKLPNRAVKVGGIFAIGLVAVGLAFASLMPNAAEAHPGHEHDHPVSESTPAPAPDSDATPDMSQSRGMAREMVFVLPQVCFTFGTDVHVESSASVVKPEGYEPVKSSNEVNDTGKFCMSRVVTIAHWFSWGD